MGSNQGQPIATLAIIPLALSSAIVGCREAVGVIERSIPRPASRFLQIENISSNCTSVPHPSQQRLEPARSARMSGTARTNRRSRSHSSAATLRFRPPTCRFRFPVSAASVTSKSRPSGAPRFLSQKSSSHANLCARRYAPCQDQGGLFFRDKRRDRAGGIAVPAADAYSRPLSHAPSIWETRVPGMRSSCLASSRALRIPSPMR